MPPRCVLRGESAPPPPPLPQTPVPDLDVHEERPAGEHDARRPRDPRAGREVGPAHLRAGLHVHLDALGDEQVDVSEQRTSVDVGITDVARALREA